VSVETTSERIAVVMAPQRCEALKVEATDRGLPGVITVGRRGIRFDDNELTFTE
jgi:hypothetical protein